MTIVQWFLVAITISQISTHSAEACDERGDEKANCALGEDERLNDQRSGDLFNLRAELRELVQKSNVAMEIRRRAEIKAALAHCIEPYLRALAARGETCVEFHKNNARDWSWFSFDAAERDCWGKVWQIRERVVQNLNERGLEAKLLVPRVDQTFLKEKMSVCW